MERQERREQILNILAAGIRKVLLNTVPKPEELQEGITRLRIQVEMKDETHLQVELEDLGFGSFRTATHHIWKEEIQL